MPDLRQSLAGGGGGPGFTPLIRIDPHLRWGTVVDVLALVYPETEEEQVLLGLETLEPR